MILSAWFDHVEARFSFKEVQLKKSFARLQKTLALLLETLMKGLLTYVLPLETTIMVTSLKDKMLKSLLLFQISLLLGTAV